MSITRFPHGVSSFGQTLHGGDMPQMGKAYHVRKAADTNYDEWYDNHYFQHYDGTDSVHTTITAAVADADAFDTIYIYPGTWTETAVVDIAAAKDHLKILGVGQNGAASPAVLWQQYEQTTGTLTIQADGVEVAGIQFVPDLSYPAIHVASSTSVYSGYIHHCKFYDSGQNNLNPMVRVGADAAETQNLTISDNFFHKGFVALRMQNSGRYVVARNLFTPLHTCTALYITPYGQGSEFILDNRFVGHGTQSNQMGIYFSAAVSGQACIMVDGNHFVNMTDNAACNSVIALSTGLNYTGATVISVSG